MCAASSIFKIAFIGVEIVLQQRDKADVCVLISLIVLRYECGRDDLILMLHAGRIEMDHFKPHGFPGIVFFLHGIGFARRVIEGLFVFAIFSFDFTFRSGASS
jgi:hypothetical protein